MGEERKFPKTLYVTIITLVIIKYILRKLQTNIPMNPDEKSPKHICELILKDLQH